MERKKRRGGRRKHLQEGEEKRGFLELK